MSRTRKPPKKSKSEILRAIFFKHYMKEKPMDVEFDDYYESKMDKLIEYYEQLLIK